MARKPNKNLEPKSAGSVEFTFLPHEFATLKHHDPTKNIGEWQRLENALIDQTVIFLCTLDAVQFARLINYIKRCVADPDGYGKGGPNKRIVRACIPALRRIGTELLPEWAAPSSRAATTKEAAD